MCTARSIALGPNTFQTALRILTISKYFFHKNKLKSTQKLECSRKKADLHNKAQIDSSWLGSTLSVQMKKHTFAKKHCMIICKAKAILPTQKAHVIILNYTQKFHFLQGKKFHFYVLHFFSFFLQRMHWFLPGVHYMPPFTSQIPVLCTCKISSSCHFSHLYDQCQSLQKWSFKGNHGRNHCFWTGSTFNAP